MPVMSGLEALPLLRRIVPDARIVVISGFADSLLAGQVRSLGANAYIEKGSSIEAILAALEETSLADSG